jgi:hypothetical protein
VDKGIPRVPVMDLSKLAQPAPIQPIVVNLQFHLIGDQSTLKDELNELVTLLNKISSNGQAAMNKHNAEVRAKQTEGTGH